MEIVTQKLLHTASPTSPDQTLEKKDFASIFWRDVFLDADAKKSSDIHVQQFSDRIRVRFRLQGEMVIVKESIGDKLTRNTLINRFKQICNLDLSTNDDVQDQSMDLLLTNSRYRVALVPGLFGETFVLRVIRSGDIPSLDNVKLPLPILNDLKWALAQHQGFICITGPTGSGKSTTLQAALMSVDRISQHVITIEDPIERVLADITQEQITKKLTWEKAIKMAMRQDPDIILVGEIRDKESASLALEAAQTGHLVLSTLHTNDAAGIVDRLIGLDVDRKLIADNLLFISAQRLIQTLCNQCKIKDLNGYFIRGNGCEECRHQLPGIKGRMPIVEYAIKPRSENVMNFNKKTFREKELKTTLYLECERLIAEGLVDSRELEGWKTVEE